MSRQSKNLPQMVKIRPGGSIRGCKSFHRFVNNLAWEKLWWQQFCALSLIETTVLRKLWSSSATRTLANFLPTFCEDLYPQLKMNIRKKSLTELQKYIDLFIWKKKLLKNIQNPLSIKKTNLIEDWLKIPNPYFQNSSANVVLVTLFEKKSENMPLLVGVRLKNCSHVFTFCN